MNEKTGIGEIKGIGEKLEKTFQRIGIYTVGDLIRYYPRAYDIYEEPVLISELQEGIVQTISGAIVGKVSVSSNRQKPVTTVQIRDLSGTIKAVWFRMPFLRSALSARGPITLRGRIVRKKGYLLMEHPEIFYPPEKYEEKRGTLMPVYPLTSGLTNNQVTKFMRQALGELSLTEETLSEKIRKKYHLAEYNYAVRGIHFPEDKEVYYHARNRLVFEEFLRFILHLRALRSETNVILNSYPIEDFTESEQLINCLPYELTAAQRKVWGEIKSDLGGETCMSRLIQGDVGCGKTILAILALTAAVNSGYQGALMVPTEVLARQHYTSVTELFEKYDMSYKVLLLTGSMTAKEKRIAYERIESGEAKIIIGTHALIQEKVVYKCLGLVITDEQHRFGVRQREMLVHKGASPHVLVMSATPIPRTLAIILYGDLDISVIDELPANRLPIKNCVVDTDWRPNAYRFIKKQIAAGHQCYIICPMVEESSGLDAENVMDYAEELRGIFGPSFRIAYLHGRMKQEEKDRIMESFMKGEIHILVSTTVIEVGINVPNATVMMIENAERFGLAQLHQLRGRVGRGKDQSYCIFMTGPGGVEKKKRLEILNRSNDGFEIASEDLRQRGPGDLFGIRQSGLLDFRLGDVYQDALILQQAAEAAREIKDLPDDYKLYPGEVVL